MFYLLSKVPSVDETCVPVKVSSCRGLGLLLKMRSRVGQITEDPECQAKVGLYVYTFIIGNREPLRVFE